LIFSRNPGALIGAAILFVLLLAAIGASWIAPYDPLETTPDSALPPSREHWMGTDLLGRDIFSRVIHGARLSLLIGLVGVLIGVSGGTTAGLLAGYRGGWVDAALMRFADGMLTFPGIMLALTVVATLGPGITNVMLAVGVAAIPSYARLARGVVLSAKQNMYVEAAQVVGGSNLRIMALHILPNILAPVIVVATAQFGLAILTASGLSFLGLGAQPPEPEWGLMVSMGRDYLGKSWWMSTFPGLAITTAVIAVNLVGDGLREALDPSLRLR
jgi:peptide/nickel transport system permease protein